jgi:siroheme synthase
MPGRELGMLAAEWLAEGLPPDFPCAIVSRAAQPGQTVFRTTLGELGDAEPAQAPSLLLAGWAIQDAASALAVAAEQNMAATA